MMAWHGMAWMDGWMEGGQTGVAEKQGLRAKRADHIKSKSETRADQQRDRTDGVAAPAAITGPWPALSFCRDAGEMNRLWFPSERFSVNPSTTTTTTTTHLARHGGQACTCPGGGGGERAGGCASSRHRWVREKVVCGARVAPLGTAEEKRGRTVMIRVVRMGGHHGTWASKKRTCVHA